VPEVGLTQNMNMKNKKTALFVLGLLCVMSPALILNYLLSPPTSQEGVLIAVKVNPGASTREIAQLLYSHRLIKSPLFFRLMAKNLGIDGSLRSGTYSLMMGSTMREILDLMRKGIIETQKLTVPEGFTAEKIGRLVEELGIATTEAFLTECREFAKEHEFAGIDPAVIEPLEGYLFPDTYVFGMNVTPREIIKTMNSRFYKVFDEERASRAKQIGLSVHEVVTLASIVEREAKVPEERPVIAGVYLNRLSRGMKLDADPTVLYALGKTAGLTTRDLSVDSPYNTYEVIGLPPGAICNPGKASIDSVLWATEVDYLYFVAKDDGTHVFSKTLKEHSRNIRLIKEARKKP
jgi:UPF0755 protein